MLTLGFVTIDGRPRVQCGTAHLTAFVGVVSVDSFGFGVNAVDPLHDAGSLQVCRGLPLGSEQ